MDKDKQSNFAFDTERTFEMKGNNCDTHYSNSNNGNDKFAKLYANLNAELEKEIKKEKYEKIRQRLDKLILALAREMEKEYDEAIEKKEQELNAWASAISEQIEKGYEEKKKGEKKNRWIVIGIFWGWSIIVAFLFRYSFAKSIFIGTTILGVFGSIISLIVEAHSKVGQGLVHIRGDKETVATGIVKEIMAIVQTIREESLLHFASLICVATLLGQFLGSNDVIRNTSKFIVAGCYALKSTDEDDIITAKENEETLTVIMAGCDEKTINMLQQAVITPEELNTITALSQQDRDLVFFLNRKDLDWTDQNAVNEAVSQMIDEKYSMQMENVFDKSVNDGGAPQWLCNLVAQASEDEISAVSFSEIKSIRDVRADAFEQYPKKSLANLLSNDNQKLAIVLYINGGEEESIVYYYGQSILRDFECLQFVQNSNATIKDKLISIAQRYRDMVYTCPGMENLENASVLAEAFENAANQY